MDYNLDEYIPKPPSMNTRLIDTLERYKNNQIVTFALTELYGKALDPTIDELTPEMCGYLEMLDQGIRPDTIDNMTEISPSTIVIWKRTNKLFDKCLEIIKESQAEQLENRLWDEAMQPLNKDPITRMFLLKARKPEYKENALPPAVNLVSVRVTIDGKDFDTTASTKTIEPLEELDT